MLILVTGGTGTLGQAVVPGLVKDGHTVRVLTRRPRTQRDVQGDLETGEGIRAAVESVDAIVHLASAPHRWKTPRVDVHGTRRLLEAARKAEVGHLLYVSIVGVDEVPSRYFRFKLAAERMVMNGDVSWSILRATPFPEFTETMLRMFSRLGPVVIPARTPWQTVDVAETADRIGAMIRRGASETIEEFGGPDIRPFGEYAQDWRRARGTRRPTLPLWVFGKVGRTQRAGLATTREGATGRRTWRDYLDENYSSAPGTSPDR